MGPVSDFFYYHRRAAAVAALVLVALVALACIVRSGWAPGSAGDDAAVADVALTDTQAALVDGYGEGEQALVSVLSAYAWVCEDNGSSVSFDESSYSAADASGTLSGTYAVSAMFGADIAEEAQDSAVTYAAILLADGSSSIVRVERDPQDDGEVAIAMKTAAFSGSGEETVYEGRRSASSVSVGEIDAGADAAIACSGDLVRDAVASYAATWYPDATSAAWTGRICIYYDEGYAALYFELDDADATVLAAVCTLDGTSISVAEAV